MIVGMRITGTNSATVYAATSILVDDNNRSIKNTSQKKMILSATPRFGPDLSFVKNKVRSKIQVQDISSKQ